MNDSKISVRYSKALFQSAIDKKNLDKVNSDMMLIMEICSATEMKELLQSPVIRPSKKTEILHNILKGKVEEITLSLVNLVVLNGREGFLPAIARVFISETRKYKGITEVGLTTAIPVNEKIKAQIKELVTTVFNTKVDLKESVDKEIIGGFVLKIEDNFIDASVRNKLRKIKKKLTSLK
jgi:F-type H+-transporting ATPase subunit delta